LLLSKGSSVLTLRPLAEPVHTSNLLFLLYSPFFSRVLPLAMVALGKLTRETVLSKCSISGKGKLLRWLVQLTGFAWLTLTAIPM
jgi:hypothetical protein